MPGSPLSASPCHGKVRWGMWLQNLSVLGFWLALSTKNATQACLQRVWADVPLLPPMGKVFSLHLIPRSLIQPAQLIGSPWYICSKPRICEMPWGIAECHVVAAWTEAGLTWEHLALGVSAQFEAVGMSVWIDLLLAALSAQMNLFWSSLSLREHLCFSPRKQHHYPIPHRINLYNQQTPVSFV